MSSQLIYTLTHLSQDKLIYRSKVLSAEHAILWVSRTRSLSVFIVDDRYMITVADIQRALKLDPKPEYIVHNTWQGYTDAVVQECKQNNVKFLGYRDFVGTLLSLNEDPD